MPNAAPSLVLDPRRALALELPRMQSGARRATLRALLALSGGAVSVEGADRLAAAPEPAIFALTHHNYWEAVLAPAAIVALRRGRSVRFLVDWMFVELPWTGWLVRQVEPIAVYGKRARFRWRESDRLVRRREPALERAVAALERGDDVGLYSEGARNPDPWLLGAPRRGLARLALRSGAAIVPVGLDFLARDRLRRTPRAGRFVVRVGEPRHFHEERAAWLAAGSAAARLGVERRLGPALGDRVHADLARLARKVYCR
jgi:1-acyl-sn-glycerol-3-phosphate acyltransferase